MRRARSLYLALAVMAVAPGCLIAVATTPVQVTLSNLKPSGPRPGAFADARLSIYVDPAVGESATLHAVGLRDVAVVTLRTRLLQGLRATFADAFAEVTELKEPKAEGLWLRLDGFELQHVKTGNVPVSAGAVVPEVRFDVHFRAALLRGTQLLASVTDRVEGREMSAREDDLPIMLTHAVEDGLARLATTLFADEALVSAGGKATGGLSATQSGRPDPEKSIAVMPLVAEGVGKRSVRILDELLVVAVDEQGPYAVISTADMNALLGHERLRDAMGCDDVTCAAEIGGALGVGFLLTGSVSKLGSNVIVTLNLLNTRSQSATARGQATVKDDEDLYPQAVKQAVRDLLGAARVR